MKNKIKEIKVEDCVECYVSDTHTPSKESKIDFIIGYSGRRFISITGRKWICAIPCEELDNPPKPKWSDKYPKEWSIHAKVFKALSEGAVLIHKEYEVCNYWSNHRINSFYQICTNYTGTSTDVLEEIE